MLEYAERLAGVAERVREKLFIVPRIYTNKPRTKGTGYKGLLHNPDPEASKDDLLEGIKAIRHMHLRVAETTGLFGADEMLYPSNYQVLNDVLSYVAVGARSVENQEHRLVAGGIPVPVGLKNPTGGSTSVLLNSIFAAQQPQTFIYRNWEVESKGNPYTHAILRGFVDNYGKTHPNYHFEDLIMLSRMYGEATSLQNPAVIVDCNHANSDKKYLEQIRIAKEVLHSTRHSDEVNKLVKGLMIESYIEDGAQSLGGCVYGKSITDPCLGWEKTERLIYEIADLR